MGPDINRAHHIFGDRSRLSAGAPAGMTATNRCHPGKPRGGLSGISIRHGPENPGSLPSGSSLNWPQVAGVIRRLEEIFFGFCVMRLIGVFLVCLAALWSAQLRAEEQPACPHNIGWQPSAPELDAILTSHQAWLEKQSGNLSFQSRRAVLCNADLSALDLQGRSLREADLRNASLKGLKLENAVFADAWLQAADFSGAKMKGAKLQGADLRGAKFIGTNLRKSDLSGAQMQKAQLMKANLEKAKLAGLVRLTARTTDDYSMSWADLSEANRRRANVYGEILLSDAVLKVAELEWVNLDGADLTDAILRKADLSGLVQLVGADLTRADLEKADFTGATLTNAIMVEADLRRADFTRAFLTRVDLTRAQFNGTDITKTGFWQANLTDAFYEPITVPRVETMANMLGLETVRWRESKLGLFILRAAFRTAGIREQERQVTYAIEHGATCRLLVGWYCPAETIEVKESDKIPGQKALSKWNRVEGVFRLVFLEWPVDYGLSYGRPIGFLVLLTVAMSLVYLLPLTLPDLSGRGAGIYRIWPRGRIDGAMGSYETVDDEQVERLRVTGPWVLVYAFYFSVLSAFHLGWRDFNVGSWLARLQPREYLLRGRGWVRTVSGAQSLVSVYMVAIWALTYFGRPFQ